MGQYGRVYVDEDKIKVWHSSTSGSFDYPKFDTIPLGSIKDNPTENEPQAVRTIYALSKLLGSFRLLTDVSVSYFRNKPSLYSFCNTMQDILTNQIESLCKDWNVDINSLYLSPKFNDYLNPGTDFDTYITNCGLTAYLEECTRIAWWLSTSHHFKDGELDLTFDIGIQIQTILDTSKMAVVQALLLYKETLKTNDAFKIKLVKDMQVNNLLLTCIQAQVLFFLVMHQNGFFFIPHYRLKGEIRTDIGSIEPISPNERLVECPDYLFITLDANRNNDMFSSSNTYYGKERGLLCAINGEVTLRAINTLVENIMANL